MISPRNRTSKPSKSIASATSNSRNSLSKQAHSIRRLPLPDDAEHEDPAAKPAVKRSNPRSSSTTKPRTSVSCRNLDPSKEPRKIRSAVPEVSKPRTSSVQRSRSSDEGEQVRPPSSQRHRSSVDGSIVQRRAMSAQKRPPDLQEIHKSEHRPTIDSTNAANRSSSAARIQSDASNFKPMRSEQSKSHTNSTEKSKSSSRSSCPDGPGKPTRRKISNEDSRSVQSNQGRDKTPEKKTRRKVTEDGRPVHSSRGGDESPVKHTRRKITHDSRSVHSHQGVEESPGKHTRRKVTDDSRSVHSHQGVEESPGKRTCRKVTDDSRSVPSKGNPSSEGHPPRSKRNESVRPAKDHPSTEPRSPAKRRTVAAADARHSPGGKRHTTTRRTDEERKHRSSHRTSSSAPRDHKDREKSSRKQVSSVSSASAKEKSTNDAGGKALRRPSLLDTSAMQKVEADKVQQRTSEDASDSERGGSVRSSTSHCSYTSSASTVIQFDPTQKDGVAHVEQKESFTDDDDCLSIASFHDPIGDAHRIMNTNAVRVPILSFLDSDGEELDEQQSCFSPTELQCPSGGESVQGGLQCPSGGESVQTSDSNTSSTLGKLQFYVPSSSATTCIPSHPLIFDIEEFQDFVTSSEEKSAVNHSIAPKSAGTKKKTKEKKDDGESFDGKRSPEQVKSESVMKKKKDGELTENGNAKRQLKPRGSRRLLKKTTSSEQLFEAAVMQMKNESNGLQPPSDDDDSDSEDERLRNNFSRTLGLAVGATAYESELELSPSKKQPKAGLGIGKYFFGSSHRKKRDANGDDEASDSDYSCSSTSSRRSVFGGRMGRRHSLLGNGDFENAVVPFSS
jgi:hypothetical protein